jgi:hypothetical protein
LFDFVAGFCLFLLFFLDGLFCDNDGNPEIVTNDRPSMAPSDIDSLQQKATPENIKGLIKEKLLPKIAIKFSTQLTLKKHWHNTPLLRINHFYRNTNRLRVVVKIDR